MTTNLKMYKGVIVSAAALLIMACATIVGDKTHVMNVSSNPSEADVTITDEKGLEVFTGKDPTNVTLQKSDGSYWGKKSYKVMISKPGFAEQTIAVTANANGWYILGNLVFGGLIGWFIVDPFNGGMYTFSPKDISATLGAKDEQTAPTPSASSAAQTPKGPSVTAQEQPSQNKSVTAGNENAAPGGSSNVQLAMSFEDGVNAYGQKDYTKALSIFRGLADQGDARAQTNFGLMYELGLGVAKDDAEAVKWFRKAADQNFVTAQFNLGYMYSNGRGVAKDNAEAVKWYRKAADRGHATAQFNLGLKYEKGEGVVKDHAEAVKWFRKAADQGYAPAQETLRRLGGQ